MTDGLLLYADSLLSKWGFNDGDMPDGFLDWLDEHHPDVATRSIDWHATLCRLVRERLLPALYQRVEVEEIGTSHNPIRAVRVDGYDVEPMWTNPSASMFFSPDFVAVPYSDVLAMIVWRDS